MAQTQVGYVKTKGRMDTKGNIVPGSRLSETIIQPKDRQAVLSHSDGSFSFPVPEKTFILLKVFKQGYVLTDPDILSHQYSFSSNPLVLVLETPEEQLEDMLIAQRKIRQTLMRQLEDKEKQLDSLRAENRIAEEEYRQSLQSIYAEQNNNESLIREMAERYSKIDFDILDAFNKEISRLIMEGQLYEADSLINSKGNINERANALKLHQEANAQEERTLNHRRQQLDKSKAKALAELEDLAQDCYSKFEIFKLQHLLDSATQLITLRASLDTNNVEWQREAGHFLSDYIADYNLALFYYERALRVVIRQYGEIHPEAASCLNDIGRVYRITRDDENSLTSYQRALEIQKQTLGDSHIETSITYGNLGSFYENIGDYFQAREYYVKSLEILEKDPESTKYDLALLYGDLGVVYDDLCEFEISLDYYIKALQIQEETLGPEHPDLATTYSNLGMLYYQTGDYGQALEFLSKALDIQETVLGSQHPNTAITYDIIGGVYDEWGANYPKALEYFFKALTIRENTLGPNHPDVALSFNNIGTAYDNQEELEQALTYYSKAINVDPNLAAAYCNIGNIYHKQERYPEAIQYYSHALELLESQEGRDNLDVATLFGNIGMVYNDIGDYNKALEYCLACLEIEKNILGEEHLNVAISYSNIGLIYSHLNDFVNAETFCRRSIEIKEIVLGHNHLSTAQSYDNMSVLYRINGDYSKALEYMNKALEIRENILGPEHSITIKTKKTIEGIRALLDERKL